MGKKILPQIAEPLTFCGIPELMTADVIARAWRKRMLRWTLLGTLPGWSAENMLRVGHAVYSMTPMVCGLKIEYTDTARVADIRVNVERIDNRYGTLAYAELPNGSDGPLRMMFDTSEEWGDALEPGGHKQGLIPLVLTWLHESGHSWGLGHTQNKQSVMYPSLNTGLARWVWQDEDVKVLQSAYGLPTTPAPPAPERAAILEEAIKDIEAAIAKTKR